MNCLIVSGAKTQFEDSDSKIRSLATQITFEV